MCALVAMSAVMGDTGTVGLLRIDKRWSRSGLSIVVTFGGMWQPKRGRGPVILGELEGLQLVQKGKGRTRSPEVAKILPASGSLWHPPAMLASRPCSGLLEPARPSSPLLSETAECQHPFEGQVKQPYVASHVLSSDAAECPKEST